MKFLKTTLIGGFVFLVPISVLIFIIGKAYEIMVRLSEPAARWVPVDTVAGIAKANILALVAIVAICFLAGLISRSRLASRAVGNLEARFLNAIPGYSFIKGVTGGMVGIEEEESQPSPVLARFDDAWQIAFITERLGDGRVVVFVPGAPEPWPGSLLIMEEARIQPIDQSATEALRYIRALGRECREILPASTS